MDGRRSVLIVDASDETRIVLQTALEHRGLRTMAASRAKQGLAMAQQHHPDLIVLDLEIDSSGPNEVVAPFAEQSRTDHASLVLLGSVRRQRPLAPATGGTPTLQDAGGTPTQQDAGGTPTQQDAGGTPTLPVGEYVAKPYHYAPLIRRIEEILAANPERAA